jgi:hypothetical protein
MNCVKLDLLIHNFDFQFDLVEGLGDGLQLADGVVNEAATFASVVKMKTGFGLVVAKVRRSPEPLR